MFIELVDVLRCPNPHQESWLVASSDRMSGRDIMEGLLGCPICRAEYPIRGGVVQFAPASRLGRDEPSSDEQAMRLAAFLDLSNARSFAVLLGDWGNHARAVQTLVDVPLLLVNPPPGVDLGGGLSGITCARALPLAHRTAHGIALDAGVDADFVLSALAAVRAGGRVVAPVTLELPDGVTPLVRDEELWVGETGVAAEGLVPLRRKS